MANYIGRYLLTGSKEKILGLIERQEGDTYYVRARNTAVVPVLPYKVEQLRYMDQIGRVVDSFNDPTFKLREE